MQLAAAARVFARKDGHHMSRTPLVLDEEGWQATGRCIEDALRQVCEIQQEAAERLAGDGDEGISSTLLLLHFETPSQD